MRLDSASLSLWRLLSPFPNIQAGTDALERQEELANEPATGIIDEDREDGHKK